MKKFWIFSLTVPQFLVTMRNMKGLLTVFMVIFSFLISCSDKTRENDPGSVCMETMVSLEATGLNEIIADGTTSLTGMIHSDQDYFMITKRNNTDKRNSVFFTYDAGIYNLIYSTDNGVTWDRLKFPESYSFYPHRLIAASGYLIVYDDRDHGIMYLDYRNSEEKNFRNKPAAQLWNADESGNIYYLDYDNKYYTLNLYSDLLTEVSGPPFIPEFMHYHSQDSAWAGVNWTSLLYNKTLEIWNYNGETDSWKEVLSENGRLLRLYSEDPESVYAVIKQEDSTLVLYTETRGLFWERTVLPSRNGNLEIKDDGTWIWNDVMNDIYFSADHGISWEKTDISSGSGIVYFISRNEAFRESENKVYRTYTAGSDWVFVTDLNANDPYTYVQDVRIDFIDCMLWSILAAPGNYEGDEYE